MAFKFIFRINFSLLFNKTVHYSPTYEKFKDRDTSVELDAGRKDKSRNPPYSGLSPHHYLSVRHFKAPKNIFMTPSTV